MELIITKFSARLADDLFYKSTCIEKIGSGYKFSEGPVWDAEADSLYFTDFQDFLIYRWTKDGGAKVYRKDSGRAIGLAMYPDGRLVSAESYNHAIAYTDNEENRLITDSYSGKKLSSPNDLLVTQNGDICFTDPYSTSMDGPREINFNGVYRVTPAGETRLLYAEMPHPNGLAFSPDESLLYVNDTSLQHIIAFDVYPDGSVLKRGVFTVIDSSYGPGAPDGMKLDALGNIYVTGSGGIWVFAPDAEPIALLHIPEVVGNFCFGGSDRESLYITASSSVYRTRVKIGGVLPFGRQGVKKVGVAERGPIGNR